MQSSESLAEGLNTGIEWADTILLHLGKLFNWMERSRQGSHAAKAIKMSVDRLNSLRMDF